MPTYQILDWDTEILGIPTAKIIPEQLTVEELAEALAKLKQAGIKLVYWCSDSHDQISQQAAKEFSGMLADRKLTYLIDLNHAENFELNEVEPYLDLMPTNEMNELALSIGRCSRFKLDPRITNEQMTKVYKTWMINSTKKVVAKEVLVIKKENKVIGMTTLGEKNGRSDIGLLAVDPKFQGMQLGSKLVRASQHWGIQHGYQCGQVVTQQTNQAACKLYEKCGYQLEKVEFFYHFWL